MRRLFLIFLVFGSAFESAAQCPTLTVVGPANITVPGDEISFRAELNVAGPKVSYSWSVNAGTIVKGQGTPEIMVAATSELAGHAITATVEVGGFPSDCKRTASEVAGVAPRLEGQPSDEWSGLKPNDERGRLDMFFAELSINPTNIGMLIIRVKAGDRLDPSNSRIQLVLKHAKFRKFDRKRIWFAVETAEERSTQVWRIPPGAETPCSECLIFRGESL